MVTRPRFPILKGGGRCAEWLSGDWAYAETVSAGVRPPTAVSLETQHDVEAAYGLPAPGAQGAMGTIAGEAAAVSMAMQTLPPPEPNDEQASPIALPSEGEMRAMKLSELRQLAVSLGADQGATDRGFRGLT